MGQTSDQIAPPRKRILSKKAGKHNNFRIIGIFRMLVYNFKIGNGWVAQW